MLRILIVEDDALLAADLRDVVAGVGYTVLGPVDSVSHAREAVTGCDAALLDANVADGTTFELAMSLQQAGRPFVFVTALSPSDLPPALASAYLLRKPYRIADIRHWLARLVEAPGIAAMNFAAADLVPALSTSE